MAIVSRKSSGKDRVNCRLLLRKCHVGWVFRTHPAKLPTRRKLRRMGFRMASRLLVVQPICNTQPPDSPTRPRV